MPRFRVVKSRHADGSWVVHGTPVKHPLQGPPRFQTWREAIDYAASFNYRITA
jgi:hypothetical protein